MNLPATLESSAAPRTLWQRFGLFAGPVAAVLVYALFDGLHDVDGYGDRPARAAAMGTLMAVWWFTEALPIAWTAAVPLVALPALGIFDAPAPGTLRRSVEPYFDAYIFLFFGGMVIGAAMERWNLHRRLALHVLARVGTSPSRLLLGVLASTALVSMWISNTATAVMMVPIAGALVTQLEADSGRRLGRFGAAALLAVAYGANVGGIGTKIGTGTNSIFAGHVSEALDLDVGFLQWMAVGVPFVLLFLPVIWGVLWLFARRDPAGHTGAEVVRRELRALGVLSTEEKKVALVFAGAALLWVLGDPLRRVVAPLVEQASGFAMKGKHWEAAVGLLAAGALLAGRSLAIKGLRRLPWGTLVLLGGSFALASGIEASGLALVLSNALAGLADLSLPLQLLLVSAATIGLSAVASNTATINVMLNVLPGNATLLATSTIAASCDFALPAGTPPNAIVFASGRVRLPVMMRTGALLDVAAALLATLYGVSWITRVL